MIQLHRLEGFYRVAVARGYTRAARDFPYPITQPAVYQQVRKLEDELGVSLFERAGRDRVVLTSHGRALYRFCAPFFDGLPSVLRTLTDGSFSGRLRVEVAPLEMRHLVPAWVARLRKIHPDLELGLVEVDHPDPRGLLQGRTDLVVDHLPWIPDGVSKRAVAEHHGFVVTHRNHPFARARSFRPSLLADTPLVAYLDGSPARAQQRTALASAGMSPQVAVSASSSDAILALVQAGMGFSVIPWPDAEGPRMRGVVARRVPGAQHRFSISIAWRRRAPPDPLIECALAAL